jgi:hypothetical protein
MIRAQSKESEGKRMSLTHKTKQDEENFLARYRALHPESKAAISPDACNDCGVLFETKSESGGTGYAIMPDNRRVCYACCGKRDAESLNQGEPIILYLTIKHGAEHKDRFVLGTHSFEITNWPGTLRFSPQQVNAKRYGHFVPNCGFVERIDCWFKSPNGQHHFHGVVRGDMQLMRVYKIKG